MADLTMAEISAQITDPAVKAIVDAIVLPAEVSPAELLGKIVQAASAAASAKNQGKNSGDEDYIGAYPEPAIATPGSPPRLRIVFPIVVEAPINLDNASSPLS